MKKLFYFAVLLCQLTIVIISTVDFFKIGIAPLWAPQVNSNVANLMLMIICSVGVVHSFKMLLPETAPSSMSVVYRKQQ